MRSLLLLLTFDDTSLCGAASSGAEGFLLDRPDVPAAGVARLRESGRPVYLALPNLDLADVYARLDHAAALELDGIALMSSRSGRDVTRLDARLTVCEAKAGLPPGRLAIIAAAGATAASLLDLQNYVAASERLTALLFDATALAAELDADPCAEAVRHGRSLTLFAARAAGLPILHGVLPEGTDYAALRREGFDGAVTARADEVKTLHAVFGG
jgi:citrate lyase subunit beta / citryl-CoA lyase